MSFPAIEAITAAGLDPAAVRLVASRVDPAVVAVRRAPFWFWRLWLPGIAGVALPWAIYLRPDVYRRDRASLGGLIVHELVHIDQFRRVGAVSHVALYLGDYLVNRLRGMKHWDAYRGIRFEREARLAKEFVVEASS